MDTLSKMNRASVSTKTEDTKAKSKFFSSFWEMTEFNRFGIVPLLLAFVACLGGITVGYGVNTDFELLLTVFSNGFVLIGILALAPMRFIIATGAIAFIVDLSVLIF